METFNHTTFIFPSTLTFIALKKNQNFFYLPSNYPCLFIYMQFITAFFSKFEMIDFFGQMIKNNFETAKKGPQKVDVSS